MLVGCGSLFITVNCDEEDQPFEVFVRLGKAGGCAASYTEVIARLVSLLLRCGVDPVEVESQLVGVACHQRLQVPWPVDGCLILSCADSIGKALRAARLECAGRASPAAATAAQPEEGEAEVSDTIDPGEGAR